MAAFGFEARDAAACGCDGRACFAFCVGCRWTAGLLDGLPGRRFGVLLVSRSLSCPRKAAAGPFLVVGLLDGLPRPRFGFSAVPPRSGSCEPGSRLFLGLPRCLFGAGPSSFSASSGSGDPEPRTGESREASWAGRFRPITCAASTASTSSASSCSALSWRSGDDSCWFCCLDKRVGALGVTLRALAAVLRRATLAKGDDEKAVDPSEPRNSCRRALEADAPTDSIRLLLPLPGASLGLSSTSSSTTCCVARRVRGDWVLGGSGCASNSSSSSMAGSIASVLAGLDVCLELEDAVVLRTDLAAAPPAPSISSCILGTDGARTDGDLRGRRCELGGIAARGFALLGSGSFNLLRFGELELLCAIGASVSLGGGAATPGMSKPKVSSSSRFVRCAPRKRSLRRSARVAMAS